MPTEVILPDYGTSADRVTLVRWLKNEGDPVERGDSLCEIETDKAVSELEAFVEGTLLRQVADEGSEVEIGAVIAYIGAAGEDVPKPSAQAADSAPPPASTPESPAPGERLTAAKASPLARKLAKDLAVDLSQVAGTGCGGKITRQDIVRAKEQADQGAPPSGPQAGEAALGANQRSVIRRITESSRETIPIRLASRIHMGQAIRRRENLRAELGRKITYDALFVHTVARIMEGFPHFRSRLSGEQLLTSDDVHVGVAVSIEDELYIPVVHNAHRRRIDDIDSVIRKLADKAGAGRLGPQDVRGATMTVSNLGMYPVEWFDAVIPPAQAAVLTIGAVEEVPVFKDNKVLAAEPVVRVLLCVDHRMINGREAARFLAELRTAMESE